MKRVLIIGGNSYIGKQFYKYIKENKVREMDIFLVSASDGTWEDVDFSEYDTVLHLAAIVHKKEKKNMKELYFRVNHRLAINIAQKAKEKGVKQFIFMSTAAIYGKLSGCITKDTLPNPNTYYGMSKLAAEKDLIKLQDNRFSVVIVRPPMVYGEGCKGNYQKLIKLAKYMLLFPDYHNSRSILHINNLNRYLEVIIINELGDYHYPQDMEYADTCKMVVDIRKIDGKNTYLTRFFNKLIPILIKRVEIFNKIFGDFYYKL